MLNPKFTIESDFVNSFINRILLQKKFKKDPIVRDAMILEGCVNLNTINLNISECGNKRDNVDSFFEANQLESVKQQIVESCSNELLEAHSMMYQNHRSNFPSLYSKIINEIALKESLSNLTQCMDKI